MAVIIAQTKKPEVLESQAHELAAKHDGCT
jgi:hypothetical protein